MKDHSTLDNSINDTTSVEKMDAAPHTELNQILKDHVYIASMKKLKGFEKFKTKGQKVLVQTVSKLLNCEVDILTSNYRIVAEKFSFDIEKNIRRFVYVINDDTVVLSTKIYMDRKIISIIPFILRGTQVGQIDASLLNRIAASISHDLSVSYEEEFNGAHLVFSDNIVHRIIANCFSKFFFDTYDIQFLILYLQRLCKTTFENENFKTGFIITKSFHEYKKKNGNDRHGELIHLNKMVSLVDNPTPEKRFWFLVDGNRSFYVFNSHLETEHVFIKDDSDSGLSSFIDSYSLSQTLYGRDIAFRVVNKTQFSVLGLDGIEFINIENTWKLRDYKLITNFIAAKSNMGMDTIRHLMFYILYCSQNSISSIIWIPSATNSHEIIEWKLLLLTNSIFKKRLSILDAAHRTIIKRLVSSDGVTVINSEGNVLMHGCIVDLSAAKIMGLSGTGENAAKLLSKKGVSIKVSKDGSIKIFYDIECKPLVF